MNRLAVFRALSASVVALVVLPGIAALGLLGHSLATKRAIVFPLLALPFVLVAWGASVLSLGLGNPRRLSWPWMAVACLCITVGLAAIAFAAYFISAFHT